MGVILTVEVRQTLVGLLAQLLALHAPLVPYAPGIVEVDPVHIGNQRTDIVCDLLYHLNDSSSPW